MRVTPCAWLPRADTDLGIGPNPPASGTASLLDILEGALLLSGEVRRGDFGIIAELNHLDPGHGASTPGGRFSADISVQGSMASLARAWRFAGTSETRADALAARANGRCLHKMVLRRFQAIRTNPCSSDPRSEG
jgi:hypothetical protein